MSAPGASSEVGADRAGVTPGWATTPPVQLLLAAHPRQALATAAGLAVAAALSGRSPREVALVLATVLVGQALLGWDNDLVDEADDREAGRTRKPLVAGPLDRGTVWYAVCCGVLLVVPLALSSGITAGSSYLLTLVAGALGNRYLRESVLSWLPWAAAFGLYPAYLSYGGWGGAATGHPPTIAMTVVVALLGVAVHVLTSLSGLVDDHNAGRRHLPLRLALRTGAPRLLALAGVCCGVLVLACCLVGATVGLSQ